MSQPVPSPPANPGIRFADPAPLGLAGFGITTLALSIINAHWIPVSLTPIVFGLALAYGGIAQFAAGMWEFARGNTFGALAFSSYGAFWLSYWWLTAHNAASLPAADAHKGIGLYLAVWGLFTLYMSVAASRVSVAVFVVLVLLTITYGFLSAGEFATSDTLSKIGGWVGIVTAAAALYASFAGVTKFTHGRDLLPVGPR
jgi:succinate-acetate transporter protein